ncbi:MAG: sensor histidine kinase [Nitrososphaera sp.]|uniref:sensor histidine kinase n=1 Tax=Nitrososphaera sp. TaxID=1971748 RepID=UPI003D6DB97D
MSGWGSIGRPLVIIITVALASMTVVSSLLVFSSQQTTQARIELVASQALRAQLTEESMQASKAITFGLENIERTLASSAASLSGKDPESASAREIMEVTMAAIGQYTETIVWLDARGTLVSATGGEGLQDLVGSDMSDRRFYELPLATGRSSIVQSFKGVDGTSSFAVAVPVSGADGSFGGVLAALVPVSSVKASFLQIGDVDRTLIVVANDGTILVHPSAELEGKNITGPEVGAMLAGPGRDVTLQNLQLMAQGRSGVADYLQQGGEPSLMAYEPVVVRDEHPWTVAVLEPTFTVREPFLSVFEERQSFTIIATVLVAAISGVFIAFILLLNRRLFTTVSQQDTRIKSQLSELRGAYDRLKEQDVIKDEFINIAAHELRTPVLPIVLSAENLADSIPDDENVKIILRNASRITKLTNDILDVSRIESNTFKLQKQRANIKRLIDEVIQDAQLRIPRQQNLDIVFESAVPAEMEDLTIDRSRINQVLVNIVDNAVNFSDDGAIRVVMEKDGEPDLVRISVIDPGKGIDPTVKDKLFGKFVSKSDRAKGTGLGLYLCKAIVEAHGGTIKGENNQGKGATFSFTLPV